MKVPAEMGLCFPHLKGFIRRSCISFGHYTCYEATGHGTRSHWRLNGDLPCVMHVGKEIEGMRVV